MHPKDYIPLAPVRGRLPRRYQMPGETDRRVNWPVLAIWGAGISPWIYLFWWWLH